MTKYQGQQRYAITESKILKKWRCNKLVCLPAEKTVIHIISIRHYLEIVSEYVII